MDNFLVSPRFDFGDTPPTLGAPTLGILASGSGSNFETIVDAADCGLLDDVEIAGLICNEPEAGCLERAERLDVPSCLIDHRDYPDRASFDAEVVERLKTWSVDWVIMAGWMRIVTPGFIDAYRDRILNIHPSLLPSFPGAHAVRDALKAGVRMTGCTVHIVTEDVDDGPIIGQAAVPVRGDDDLDALQERIHRAEHALYPQAIAATVAKPSAGVEGTVSDG